MNNIELIMKNNIVDDATIDGVPVKDVVNTFRSDVTADFESLRPEMMKSNLREDFMKIDENIRGLREKYNKHGIFSNAVAYSNPAYDLTNQHTEEFYPYMDDREDYVISGKFAEDLSEFKEKFNTIKESFPVATFTFGMIETGWNDDCTEYTFGAKMWWWEVDETKVDIFINQNIGSFVRAFLKKTMFEIAKKTNANPDIAVTPDCKNVELWLSGRIDLALLIEMTYNTKCTI